MKTCETCGNYYENCFQVLMDGSTHVFDCFECAINALAPRCAHCKCTIIGHGIESQIRAREYFCCTHCARESGIEVDDAKL